MRPLCCNKILLSLWLLTLLLWGDERYAFVYSKNIDDPFINFYDKVIVEADALDNIYALRYPNKMVAYVSIGEIEPWRTSQKSYQKSWVISKNRTWNSLIADLTQKGYQNFLFDRFSTLYQKGYRNFFLDTMDAYHVTQKDPKLFKAQQKALISFIHQLHQRYPQAKIIINRGFELLDQIHNDIDAIVAESLIQRYNHNQKSYTPVPKADRAWLLARFKEAQKYHLDTISIEYSDGNKTQRLNLAREVKKLGILPYVTDGLLQDQGECHIQRIRREVLILFNQSLLKDNNPVYSEAHLLSAMPIEHLGYIPILHDITSQKLPKNIDDRYHAIILWINGKAPHQDQLYAFVQKAITQGVKVLFLNNFGFEPTPKHLDALGISKEPNHNPPLSLSHIDYQSGYQPFEIPASIEFEEELIHAPLAHPILLVRYPNKQTSTPLALMPWGGYALGDSFLLSIEHESFWSIDPFKLFKDALALDNIPLPDPTTEAGRRILFAHIDGDGFMERVRTNPKLLATEYLIDKIYKKYHIPQTVSLIEGEISPQGLYPKLSPRMQKIAKELYALPWIQPASHTLSHPFFWGEADEQFRNKQKKEGYRLRDRVIEGQVNHNSPHTHEHLPIPNYPKFDLKRETIDSVKFALSFAPKSKQKEKILFWSGDCLPTRIVLAYTERAGILGMNGGDTTITRNTPWLSRVAPYGLQHQEYWQIYTAQQNENVYTHDWLGPFWGYRDVIDTFELTEEPRRLKPINIYYHFYSGSKLASLNALKEVYAWAIKQKTTPLYASQYIKKARDFYATAIGVTASDTYEIHNSGFLRTVRFDQHIELDLDNSRGVAGYTHEHGVTYITLDSRPTRTLKLANHPPKRPYLIDANGWVDRVDRQEHNDRFKLHANLPLCATFYQPRGCTLIPPQGFNITRSKQQITLTANQKRGATIVFECQ